MLFERASDIPEYWSKFVDDVLHDSPKFVNANERAVFVSLHLECMNILLENIKFNVLIEEEEGNLFGSIEDFWFVKSANNLDVILMKLANELKDFAFDYFKELSLYKNSPDFKNIFPKITEALISKDIDMIIGSFEIEHQSS